MDRDPVETRTPRVRRVRARLAAGHHAQTRAWAEVARAGAHVVARFALVRERAARLVGAAMILRPRVGGRRAALGVGRARARSWQRRRAARAASRAPSRAPLRRRGVARLAVMPYWATTTRPCSRSTGSRASGFRDVQQPDGAHVCTLRIPVRGLSDAELFAGKSKEQVRWRANRPRRQGARAPRHARRLGAALRELHGAMMRGARQARRARAPGGTPSQRFAADDARGSLHVCDFEGRVVAACVALRHGAARHVRVGRLGRRQAPLLEGHPLARRRHPLGARRRVRTPSTSAASRSRRTRDRQARTPSPPSSTTSTRSACGSCASTRAGC